jgi:hypothetical protein
MFITKLVERTISSVAVLPAPAPNLALCRLFDLRLLRLRQRVPHTQPQIVVGMEAHLVLTL